MSHVRTNFDVFVRNIREFDDNELETMTTAEFDALPLADQISIYNGHRGAYNRLAGKTTDDTTTHTEDSRTDSQKFCDEFERRLDEALARAFPTAEL